MQASGSPRVGCVQYLNARPLIRGWKGKVSFATPAVLCARLARAELDVALASSFEFLRNPVYRIVDGTSISSDGEVYSVVVAHRGKLADNAAIALDPASETSVNLLRCLLEERGLRSRLVAEAGLGPNDARLLIGDRAIRFRAEHPDFSYWDLGREWKERFNLPFVYALWLVRPEVSDAKQTADRLRALRDQNLANLGALIAEVKDFSAEFCRVYYREHVRFELGEREKEGLQTFARLCARHGLLSSGKIELALV